MKRRLLLLLGLTCAMSASCSKSDSDSDDPATDSGVESSNALAIAYPQTLALAIFPEASASLRLTEEVANPYASKNVSEKVEENQKILKGEVDACINKDLFRTLKGPAPVNCYNFDSDMNPFKTATDTMERGTKDGTNGKGEACLVSFTRAEVQDAVDTVDRALALVSGMLCQAKKDGASSELPAVDGELDLKTSLGNAMGDLMTVETAKISRMADIGGNAVYKTDIKLVNDKSKTLEVHLVHSPGADDTNKGTLWLLDDVFGGAPEGMENDPNNTANKNNVMSINYARVKENDKFRMRYEVRRASIVKTVEPFTDAGIVNYDAVPNDAQNDQIHAINYVAFDIDPATNEGSLSYWQNPGGNYNESARGFLFNVTAGTDGKLSGCGVSGATKDVSIRKALKEPSDVNVLKPVRYYHPMGADNIHADKDDRFSGQEGNKISKQCFSQNADGVYAIDTAKTTHARGYDVIETAQSDVLPPKAPEAKLEGDFKE